MKRARIVTGWLLIGLAGGTVAEGCGSSANQPHNFGSGAAAGNAGKDSGSMTVQALGSSGNGGESPYDPHCGIADTNPCVPDLQSNSSCVEAAGGKSGARGGTGGTGGSGGGAPPSTGGTASSTGGSTGGTGVSTGGSGSPGPAGAGGESGATTSSEGGASQGGVGAISGGGGRSGGESVQAGESGAGQSGANVAGAAGETGTGGSLALGGRSASGGRASGGHAGSGAVTASVSCQVVENPTHKGSPLAACRPAGTGSEGSPCFSSADCAPSFACIGDGPGQCRAYCCTGPDQCQAHAGTHCAVEALVPDPNGTRPLSVPVCMPAVKCSLAGSSCPDDSACVVVSDDGTTSCVPLSELPADGKGKYGMPCPCAPGYVCSQASNTCVTLCEVAAPTPKCASGRCQASAALPAGWGTCIGVAPKDAGAP